MDRDHTTAQFVARSEPERTLGLQGSGAHVRETRYCYLLQTNHSRTALVHHSAGINHHHVYCGVRQFCRYFYRWRSRCFVLFCRTAYLELFCRLPHPQFKNIHRESGSVWESLFPAFGCSAFHHHCQSGSLFHTAGHICYNLALVLVYRCQCLHEYICIAVPFADHHGGRFESWIRNNFFIADNQVPRSYISAAVRCSTVDVHDAGHLSAEFD